MAIIPGSFNLGPDHSITIINTSTNAPVTLDGLRSRFTSKYDDELVKNSTIDLGGQVFGIRVPGGASGSIVVERASGDFDELMQELDAAYYDGAPHTFFTIIETVLDADRLGSTVTTFENVTFHGYQRGDWERTAIPKPSVEFFSSLLSPAA
jgi:hypothetical protein